MRTHPRSPLLRVALPAAATLAALFTALAHPRPAHADSATLHLVTSPRQLSFDPAGGTRELTLTNIGSAPLTLRELRLTGGASDFSLSPLPPEGQVLAPQASATVSVTYTPDPRGVRRQAFAGLQILSDDPAAPDDPATPHEVEHITAVALVANASWLLTALVFAPLAGALLLLLVPAGKERLLPWLALAAAAVPLALAAHLYRHFDRSMSVASGNHGLQFIQHTVWIPGFHIEYFVGVDGLSVTMVLLTALVSFIAVLASFGIERHLRGYFSLLLLLETGMMGVFVALDFVLFYVFWEVMLLPMYFLIGIWGGPRKEYAAIKFFLYTLVGSVLMLLVLIALYYHSSPTALVDGTPAEHSFDLLRLAHADAARFADPRLTLLGAPFAKLCWVGLFIGFAIKLPMVPFHTWLPDAHVEAPTAVSVILAGVLLKMGAYGILRINFGLLPGATRWAGPAMALFGAINILYGAFCAFAQKDLKKLVAYSSVSHMGYCLLGLGAFTLSGTSGALLQMFNHGVITSMLFLLVGVLYDRAHTRDIDRFGGVATQMPRYATFFGLAFMASLGLPGLSGFIGEMLVFLGAFPVHRTLTLLATSGVVFTAAYHLWALERIHLGTWNEALWKDRSLFPDLTTRETLTLLPLAALVLVLGFYPRPLLDLIGAGLGDLLAHLFAHGGAGAGALALR